MATKTKAPKAPLTWQDLLAKQKAGYLVVCSGGVQSHHWRKHLRFALKDAEKAKDRWGVVVEVHCCTTKTRLYEFRGLGSLIRTSRS